MKISLIVEDNGEYSLKYAEKGLKVLLLDKPWNKNIEHKNIFRCGDWCEILEEIRGFDESEKDFNLEGVNPNSRSQKFRVSPTHPIRVVTGEINLLGVEGCCEKKNKYIKENET